MGAGLVNAVSLFPADLLLTGAYPVINTIHCMLLPFELILIRAISSITYL